MTKEASCDARIPSRRKLHAILLGGVLATTCGVGPVVASPFVPTSDNQVLERLPDAGDTAARSLRAEHRALATDPTNLQLALAVARGDLDRSRALGDPRYLGRAEAALAPWPASPTAPPETVLLRSVILQSNHDFTTALEYLDQVLRVEPENAQAWLTRASIRQAQADYRGALADCGQLAIHTLGLIPDVCTAAAMTLTGHAPLAFHAIAISLTVNAVQAAQQPGVALWALTLQAETAARLDDPTAEAWFARALAVDHRDPYLLAAWSDWLLDQNRPREVVTLLADDTRIDPLLLRLALAEQRMGAPAAPGHIVDLANRFEASRLRGETVHRREEARFELELMHDPGRALALATVNWHVQREPADARILLEAAVAAAQPQQAAPALAWLRTNRVQDARLNTLAERLQSAGVKG